MLHDPGAPSRQEKIEYTADIILDIIGGAIRVEETIEFLETATPEQVGTYGEEASRSACGTMRRVGACLRDRVVCNTEDQTVSEVMLAIYDKLEKKYPRWAAISDEVEIITEAKYT